MDLDVLKEIYDLLKEENSFPSAAVGLPVRKPFNPTSLEKHLKAKFGKPIVLETIKELYNMSLIGLEENDGDYYIKGYQKKVYFFYWDKLRALLPGSEA